MKKVSTAGKQQSKNISQQRLTIGLDLGDRNSWFCVMNETGQIQLEQRVGTTAKGLREVFGAMPRSRIALEIGTHSPWVSRLLKELGLAIYRQLTAGEGFLKTFTEGTFSVTANWSESSPQPFFLTPFTTIGLNLHLEAAAIR